MNEAHSLSGETEYRQNGRYNSTRIISGEEEEISKLLFQSAERAAANPDSPCYNVIMDKFGPALAVSSLEFIKALKQKNSKYQVYFIIDIQRQNLNFIKHLVQSGLVEIRHLGGIRANFAVTAIDYFSYIKSLKEGPPTELVWSNDPNMVLQMLNIFQRLWDSGVPAEVRIKELEDQLIVGETKVFTDPREIVNETIRLAETSESEVMMLTISEGPLLRYRDVMNALSERISSTESKNKIKVRVLTPIRDRKKNRGELDQVLKGIEYRVIAFSGISFTIYDRTRAMIVQYGEDESKEESVVSAILTTNIQTVHGLASIFEALWVENELRDLHEKTARQARLLQDILSHDIRNYNQVIRLSAELLREELSEHPVVLSLVENMLKAVDGSTSLLERTKRLGRVLSEENPSLYPVNLKELIHDSLQLIKASFPEKSFKISEEYETGVTTPRIEADEILAEVFVNLFSNSAKYTQTDVVEVNLSVTSAASSDLEDLDPFREYWKIQVTDNGSGIPDALKSKVFERYLSSAKGSGLGLSIVHALVVERYKGSVRIKDRVPRDHSLGTQVEMILPKG